MGKGSATRDRILEIAEVAVLAKGFGATSIEEIIAEAGITKSGFFYHFKDKSELARGLVERYSDQNDRLLDDVFGRSRALTDDPLEQLLIGLTLMADRMAALPEGHPGCLVASISYQDRLFDREVRGLVTKVVEDWNAFFRDMIEKIVAIHPPREPVDPDQLARTICCSIDCRQRGFSLSTCLKCSAFRMSASVSTVAVIVAERALLLIRAISPM